VQRHGIGRPLHPSQLGSTPHDDITIPQIRSSHSLPLNRPRQSASRHPPVVTNRPTTYRVRCDPPLIQQPFHHPPACWSASTPFTHLIRGAQIPIAQAATPTSPSLGFLPWRFAYAGPRCTPRHLHGADIRKPSHFRTHAPQQIERQFDHSVCAGPADMSSYLRLHIGHSGSPSRAIERSVSALTPGSTDR
jgi:hypothetical protein